MCTTHIICFITLTLRFQYWDHYFIIINYFMNDEFFEQAWDAVYVAVCQQFKGPKKALWSIFGFKSTTYFVRLTFQLERSLSKISPKVWCGGWWENNFSFSCIKCTWFHWYNGIAHILKVSLIWCGEKWQIDFKKNSHNKRQWQIYDDFAPGSKNCWTVFSVTTMRAGSVGVNDSSSVSRPSLFFILPVANQLSILKL